MPKIWFARSEVYGNESFDVNLIVPLASWFMVETTADSMKLMKTTSIGAESSVIFGSVVPTKSGVSKNGIATWGTSSPTPEQDCTIGMPVSSCTSTTASRI